MGFKWSVQQALLLSLTYAVMSISVLECHGDPCNPLPGVKHVGQCCPSHWKCTLQKLLVIIIIIMQMKMDNKCTTSVLQESEVRPRKHATHHCSNSKATIPSPSSWRRCSLLLLCTDVKITFTGCQSPHPSSWCWCVHHLLLLRHTADDKITVWWPPPQAAEDGTPPVIAEAHWCHDHILPIPTLGSWRWDTTCYCWGKLQMSRSHTANPHPRQLNQGGNNWLLDCPPCSGLLITRVVGAGDDNKECNDRWWLWWWWLSHELYGLYVGGSWHHKHKPLLQV